MEENMCWLESIRASLSEDNKIMKLEFFEKYESEDKSSPSSTFFIRVDNYKKIVDGLVSIGYQIQKDGVDLGFPVFNEVE